MYITSFFISLVGIFILPCKSLGQNLFLPKYKGAIQDYIMAGHEKGWNQCVILSDGLSHKMGGYLDEDTAHISMQLNKIMTIDKKLISATSKCLLVIYHVANKADLSVLLDFGWATIDYIRLALVVKMDPEMAFDRSTNLTAVPFFVAVESSNGKGQYICPIVGEKESRLELTICKPSYVSYRNKALRIGMWGIEPYVINAKRGYGLDFLLLTMLAKRLKFSPKIVVSSTSLDSVNMV